MTMLGKHHSKVTKQIISITQKGRKHTKQEGFKKGHKVFGGIETRFKKGQGVYCPPGKRFRKHGLSGTVFYKRWQKINQRCNNPKTKWYKNYGGRGIKVEWKNFEEFKNDMYEGFKNHSKKHDTKNTTIDRIDNNGNYSKSNCRWATKFEQMRNTRRNHMIIFNGKTQCMSDWAKEMGLTYVALYKRLRKKSFGEIITGYEI